MKAAEHKEYITGDLIGAELIILEDRTEYLGSINTKWYLCYLIKHACFVDLTESAIDGIENGLKCQE